MSRNLGYTWGGYSCSMRARSFDGSCQKYLEAGLGLPPTSLYVPSLPQLQCLREISVPFLGPFLTASTVWQRDTFSACSSPGFNRDRNGGDIPCTLIHKGPPEEEMGHCFLGLTRKVWNWVRGVGTGGAG